MTTEERAKATATKVIEWCMQRECSTKKEDDNGATHYIQEALEEEREELLGRVRVAEETAEQMAWHDYKRGKKEMLEKAWHWHKTHKDGVNSYDDFVKAMEIDMNERFIEFVEIYNKLDLSQLTDEELLQYSNMGNNMMLEANEELRKRIISKYKNK